MDKLKAYEILGLEPESSVEEVKAAYAALSKKFHPEEHPEEFQLIHEAYMTLVRGNRRGRRGAVEEPVERRRESNQQEREKVESFVEDETNYRREEKKYQEAVHSGEKTEAESEEESGYDFDAALNKGEQEEAKRLHELSIRALEEFQILLKPEYREKMKLFKRFFQNQEYAEILHGVEFVRGLADLLVPTKLKKGIYDYIIDFYRLRGYEVGQLVPEAQALYRILDEKRGMEAKKKETLLFAGIPGVAAVAAVRALRNTAKAAGLKTVLVILVMLVVMVLLVKLYQKLHENHSRIFSQFVIAVGVVVSQFLVFMTDFYGTAFGTVDIGNEFAVFFILVGLIWLAVLVVCAVFVKIKNLIKGNK